MLMANSVSMLVTHHSGEDGDEDDDEDCSCHVFPFSLVVSCMLVLYQVVGTMSSPSSNFSCPAIKLACKFNVLFIIIEKPNHVVILDDTQQNLSLCLRNIHACV